MTTITPEQTSYWSELSAALALVVARMETETETLSQASAAVVNDGLTPVNRYDLIAYAYGAGFHDIWAQRFAREATQRAQLYKQEQDAIAAEQRRLREPMIVMFTNGSRHNTASLRALKRFAKGIPVGTWDHSAALVMTTEAAEITLDGLRKQGYRAHMRRPMHAQAEAFRAAHGMPARPGFVSAIGGGK